MRVAMRRRNVRKIITTARRSTDLFRILSEKSNTPPGPPTRSTSSSSKTISSPSFHPFLSSAPRSLRPINPSSWSFFSCLIATSAFCLDRQARIRVNVGGVFLQTYFAMEASFGVRRRGEWPSSRGNSRASGGGDDGAVDSCRRIRWQ